MVQFAIIELDDGLKVIELQPGQAPEDAAAGEGGVLVDPGPYRTFEEADDALRELQEEEEDERA
jgi:hypothetical protein